MTTAFPIAWDEITADWLGHISPGEPPYVTLYGIYRTATGGAPVGGLTLVPAIAAAHLAGPVMVTQAEIPVLLEADGSFAVTVLSSDAAEWKASAPIPYIIREDMTGLRAQWMAYLNGPGPIDITTLIPLAEAPDFYIPVPGPPGPPGADGAIPRYEYGKAGYKLLSTVFQHLLTLDVGDIEAGVYEVGFCVSWIAGDAGDHLVLRTRNNAGAWTVYADGNTDPNYYQQFFVQYPQVHAGGPIKVEIEGKGDGTGTVEAAYTDLWIRRVK